MRILINERRQGQKAHIIKEAIANNYAIVAHEAIHPLFAKIIWSLKVQCPKLITFDQFIKKDYDWVDGIIIHEVDGLLKVMSNSPIVAITMVKSIKI